MKTYKQIKDQLKSGDVILFNGPSLESKIIEWADKSPYSHVGMVVRIPEFSEPLLWESAPLDQFEDKIKKAPSSGVHLVDLEAIINFCGEQKYGFAYRSIIPELSSQTLSKLELFMREIDGRAFPSLFGLAAHFIEGHLHIKANTRTYFCSELVAATYKAIGIISDKEIINEISPGNFSVENEKLHFINNNLLGKEIEFIANNEQ